MLRNYLITAWRGLARQKGFTLIHIIGLAVGMAACLLILQYIRFEKSYEDFHENKEDIYRIARYFEDSGETYAANVPALGPAMQASLPEVVGHARFIFPDKVSSAWAFSYVDSLGRLRTFNQDHGLYADQGLLDLFSFEWKSGDMESALATPYSLVLTEKIARQYFGNTPPVGKQLLLNGERAYSVTGLIGDIPANSHLQFELLCSFSSLPAEWNLDQEWGWGNFYTYIQLEQGASITALDAKMPAFIASNFQEDYTPPLARFQSIGDIHLHSDILHEMQANGNADIVAFLSIIAFVVLLIAWINYINLSTSRALDRAHEVGVRKVMGASRKHLIWQFLLESLTINLLAFILAVTIVQISLPLFSQFAGVPISLPIFQDKQLWVLIPAILIGGSLLSGLYPAWVLSGFRPVAILKGLTFGKGQGLRVRKLLLVLQFSISATLIIFTLAVVQQLRFMQNKDLGIHTDQVLAVRLPAVQDSTYSSKYQYFKEQALSSPHVRSVTESSSVPGYEITWSRYVALEGEIDQGTEAKVIGVDESFVEAYQLNLIAGRNFDPSKGTDESSLILNETAARQMEIEDFEQAIGGRVQFEGTFRTLTGIIQDFHQESLKKATEAHVLVLQPRRSRYYSLQLAATDISQTIEKVESQYSAAFPGNHFDSFFLDTYFEQQYESDRKFGQIFGLFAGLAILIACLGLFALASLLSRRRSREISIRKVLGASVPNILALLSKDFVKLILIAEGFAIIIAYLGVSLWLEGYAYAFQPNLWLGIIPCAALLILSLAIVWTQSIQIANQNPAEALRE